MMSGPVEAYPYVHRPPGGRCRRWWSAPAAAVLWLAAPVAGQPTQEEFFQSMGRSLERSGMESFNALALLPLLVAAAGLVILLVLINQWRRRPAQPPALNHAGKLLREMQRSGAIERSELRRLQSAAQTQGIANPLLLALCPSLLKAPQEGPPAERKSHQQ